jgi:hypothetical protein
MTRERALNSSNVGPMAGVAAFRPRARLLKLIGAELISDEVVAVTELTGALSSMSSTMASEWTGMPCSVAGWNQRDQASEGQPGA